MAFSSPPGYAMGPSSGHVRVSHKRAPNYLERVGGSACGSLVGLGLIAVACFLLFLNEVWLGKGFTYIPLSVIKTHYNFGISIISHLPLSIKCSIEVYFIFALKKKKN